MEQVLDIRLPEDLRQLWLAYPEDMAAARCDYFSDDPEWLLGQNQMLREDPASFFGMTAWPAHYIVIGEDGNGNAFFVDLQRPGPVFRLDHAAPDQPALPVAASPAEWILWVRARLAEDEQNAAQLRENEAKRKAAKKPWWKFW